jgi:cytochrome c oxidase cbb3-type subunit 3
MRKINIYSRFFSALIFTIFFSAMSFAQDTTATATPAAASSTNQLALFMVIIAIILALVIWGMGQVLITLGRQALEKSRAGEKILSLLILITSLSPLTSHAQDQTLVVVKANYGGLDATAYWILLAVIMIEMVVIIFMLFSIRRIQAELMPATQKKVSTKTSWWKNLDKKIFTRAVAVEREQDILLDHDYDGIRELDNALPPWWKYGFYISIVAAVIYMLHFHVLGSGKNPTEEYQAEMAKAQIEMDAYNAKNADRVDENNLTMPTAAQIASGKEIFTATCWACHGKLGEGGAGPNLTDDYWIHKGSLKDVYLSVKHGYPDKGMQAWDKNFSAKEIVSLAGFIKSIKGTNPPNGKAPQGDLYTEENNNKSSADSTGTAVNK